MDSSAAKLKKPRFVSTCRPTPSIPLLFGSEGGAIYQVPLYATEYSLLAGLEGHKGLEDDDCLKARFGRISDLCCEDHCVFVADEHNHAIRMLDINTKKVRTVIGGKGKGVDDGEFEIARLSFPTSIAPINGGQLIVSERDSLNLRLVTYRPFYRVTTLRFEHFESTSGSLRLSPFDGAEFIVIHILPTGATTIHLGRSDGRLTPVHAEDLKLFENHRRDFSYEVKPRAVTYLDTIARKIVRAGLDFSDEVPIIHFEIDAPLPSLYAYSPKHGVIYYVANDELYIAADSHRGENDWEEPGPYNTVPLTFRQITPGRLLTPMDIAASSRATEVAAAIASNTEAALALAKKKNTFSSSRTATSPAPSTPLLPSNALSEEETSATRAQDPAVEPKTMTETPSPHYRFGSPDQPPNPSSSITHDRITSDELAPSTIVSRPGGIIHSTSPFGKPAKVNPFGGNTSSSFTSSKGFGGFSATSTDKPSSSAPPAFSSFKPLKAPGFTSSTPSTAFSNAKDGPGQAEHAPFRWTPSPSPSSVSPSAHSSPASGVTASCAASTKEAATDPFVLDLPVPNFRPSPASSHPPPEPVHTRLTWSPITCFETDQTSTSVLTSVSNHPFYQGLSVEQIRWLNQARPQLFTQKGLARPEQTLARFFEVQMLFKPSSEPTAASPSNMAHKAPEPIVYAPTPLAAPFQAGILHKNLTALLSPIPSASLSDIRIKNAHYNREFEMCSGVLAARGIGSVPRLKMVSDHGGGLALPNDKNLGTVESESTTEKTEAHKSQISREADEKLEIFQRLLESSTTPISVLEKAVQILHGCHFPALDTYQAEGSVEAEKTHSFSSEDSISLLAAVLFISSDLKLETPYDALSAWRDGVLRKASDEDILAFSLLVFDLYGSVPPGNVHEAVLFVLVAAVEQLMRWGRDWLTFRQSAVLGKYPSLKPIASLISQRGVRSTGSELSALPKRVLTPKFDLAWSSNTPPSAMPLAPVTNAFQSMAISTTVDMDMEEAGMAFLRESDAGPSEFAVCIDKQASFILAQSWLLYAYWPYFGRLVTANLSEMTSRVLVLPSHFPVRVLEVILKLIHGYSQSDVQQCISALSKDDLRFVLSDGFEFGILRDWEASMGSFNVFEPLFDACKSQTLPVRQFTRATPSSSSRNRGKKPSRF